MYTTSSQTIGPYLHIGMTWLVDENLAPAGVNGERVAITGRVVDGDGLPVIDAMLEVWQADAHGRYAHPEDTRDGDVDPRFSGFGRVFTEDAGRFRIHTIKPGAVPGPGGGMQAPHVNITIFMRGMLRHLTTRMYFADDPRNAHDAVLNTVPAERRNTLIALPGGGGNVEWNILLQGRNETVFFDV